MSISYKGSCLCGEIAFTASGFKEHIANCHCSMCRKFHGAAFGTSSKAKDLIWLTGLELLKDYVAPNGTTRTFCTNCGSSIGFRSKGDELPEIELALALFDGELPVNIDAHIYTENKASWYHINDSLIRHNEGRE